MLLDGDADQISPSQRIALLSVVGEALNNIREHGAGVTDVGIEIAFGHQGASARVVDDGCGFDVEAALLSAARRGRMGLAGIHERVRLLGGRCVVDSRPGGPTSVALNLPRWEPLAAGMPPRSRLANGATYCAFSSCAPGLPITKSLRARFAFPEPRSITIIEEPGLPCCLASTCDADQSPPISRSP